MPRKKVSQDELAQYEAQLGVDGEYATNGNGLVPVAEAETRDGHFPPAGTPSQESLWISNMGQQWNTVKEMLTGSKDPAEYLPRGRHSPQGIVGDARIIGDLYFLQFGQVDVGYLLWWIYQAEIGRDGEARKEVMAMSSGGEARMRKGIMSKFRTLGSKQEMMVT
jgi:hypothetical protein